MFDDEANLHALMGFKGKKGASLPPPPQNSDLDMGAGMDMGSLDLPSFEDLDKFGLTLKNKEKKKEDFKPMLPKVRMRDPAKDSGAVSFCLAPPPRSAPAAPALTPNELDTSDDEFEMEFQCAQANPFPRTMYPSVYAALQFVAPAVKSISARSQKVNAPFDSAISMRDDEDLPGGLPSIDDLERLGGTIHMKQMVKPNPFSNTMYDAVYTVLRFEPTAAGDGIYSDIDSDLEMGMRAGGEEQFVDSDLEMGMVGMGLEDSDDELGVLGDELDDGLPSFDMLDKLGAATNKRSSTSKLKSLLNGLDEAEYAAEYAADTEEDSEKENEQLQSGSSLPAPAVSSAAASAAGAATSSPPSPVATENSAFADFATFSEPPASPEAEEAEEFVLEIKDLSSGKRISLDDMNKQLEAEMKWAKQAIVQEKREEGTRIATLGQTAAGAQQVADAIARSSGQGVKFEYDLSGAKGASLMPTGRAMNPKVGGSTSATFVGWNRQSSDTGSDASRGSGLWGRSSR